MKVIFLAAVIFVQSFHDSFGVPVDGKTLELVERECEDTRSDCNWIVENNQDVDEYCTYYKDDVEVKKCAKTCGFCKAQAEPKPQKCEDTRDDCSWIAEHNDDVADYCDRHQNDTFIKQCTKTCGFCKAQATPEPEQPSKAPAPPKSETKCEDTRGDCAWITKHAKDVHAYCNKYKTFTVIKECTKTCGFCKVPATTKPEIKCEDTHVDCRLIAEHNNDVKAFCERHKNYTFVKQCTKTCGFCKAPSPPNPEKECEDTRDDCSWIAKHNDDIADYCDRHQNDTFIKQCTKTCGFCKAQATPEPEQPSKAPAPPKSETSKVPATTKPEISKAPAPPVCEDTKDCSWIKENVEDIPRYCDLWKNDVAVKKCRKTCAFC